jgi:hypothetical protein
MFLKVPENNFYTKDGIQNILIKNKNIHQCIFIFKDRDYGDIAANLSLFNIIVSGGSNTKKHILSPIQLRLARFLIAFLPLTGSNVANSFHSNRIGQNVGYDMTSKEVKKEISDFISFNPRGNGKKGDEENDAKEEIQNKQSSITSLNQCLHCMPHPYPQGAYFCAGADKGDKGGNDGKCPIGTRKYHSSSCLSLPSQGTKNKFNYNTRRLDIAPVPMKESAPEVGKVKQSLF